MNKKLSGIFEHIPIKQKKLFITIICGFIGLSLAIMPRSTGYKTKSDVQNISPSEEEYVYQLEKRLSDTIGMIDGAGKAKVFITLSGSGETIYLSNAKLDETIDTVSQTRTTSEKQLATMKNGASAETPVVVKQLSPKISGVLIVCEGGENQNVKNNIIKAASTALDVSSSRIYVTGGQITQ